MKVAGLGVQRDTLIFRIHRVLRSVEETSGLDAVDVSSRSMLNFIGEAETEERTLNVSDIVKAPGFGTPPTVYTRLSKLEEAGWIEFRPNPQDGRAKHVRLTRNARKAYARMSEAIRCSLLPQHGHLSRILNPAEAGVGAVGMAVRISCSGSSWRSQAMTWHIGKSNPALSFSQQAAGKTETDCGERMKVRFSEFPKCQPTVSASAPFSLGWWLCKCMVLARIRGHG